MGKLTLYKFIIRLESEKGLSIFVCMMNVKDVIKNIRLRWVVLVVLLVFIRTTMSFPVMGEWYARTVYPVFSAVLSRFSSLFPFSIGDCFIYGSIAGLVVYLVYAIVKRRPWLRTIGRMAEFLLWVYVWFYMAWGMNYFRMNFYARAEVPYAAYSEDNFRSFLADYTEALNASFVPVGKIDEAIVVKEVEKSYQEIAGRFGLVSPATYLHPKPMLVPALMSGVGVLGYMGPFFTEYNLNPDLLPVQYPFTYAHEMAHVLGISNEAEANLYGFLVCSRSEVPEIRFSAYFGLLPYVLGNAYQLLPEEEFNRWKETISPDVKDAYNRKVAYWQTLYSPTIGDIQDTVYNWFLKGNNIPSGRQNYSEVVALLMALDASSREK
ncbi:DUF3810 domain-containing protein [Parabacteroides goldsteinii]|jgi:hypothetical protein|uniref:DUF3810 domain-containing protein n=2 Tax=Parabacteroides goldsteinii TaxID=328812 RepID=UPI0024902EFD|nr:DUF3810 domain-containing protein [Parabacteroides goldsteinii]